MRNADVTAILTAAGAGNRPEADRLLPLVYDELRALAADQMLREPTGHTLQPMDVRVSTASKLCSVLELELVQRTKRRRT